MWRGRVYGRLGDALIAIGRLDLARRAADHLPAERDRGGLSARVDAVADGKGDERGVLAVAWAAARNGDLDTCAAITREASALTLRCRLSAIEALCLHRLGRSRDAYMRLDVIVAESREEAAAAALLVAEAFQAEPDEPAYRACAVYLAEAVVDSHPSITRRSYADEAALAHSSLVLARDIGTGLAEVAALDDLPLLGLVLRRVCRSLAAARPDDPQLSSLVDFRDDPPAGLPGPV